MLLRFSRKYLVLLIILFSSSIYCQDVIKDYYENGQIKNEYTVDIDGKPDGTARSYYEDGSPSSIKKFYKGSLHGASTWYYKTGQIQTIQNYVFGVQHGIEKNFSENSPIVEESTWDDGILLRTKTFDNNSKETISSIEYFPDKSSLALIYSNGQIISRTIYDSDNRIAVIISYDESQYITDVKFMEIDMRPSRQDLLSYLEEQDQNQEYEKLVDNVVSKFLGQDKKEMNVDNEHSIIMFQKGLLPHLVKKAELVQQNHVIHQESLITILYDYFESVNIEITNKNLHDIVKQYQANLSIFNNALKDEILYMGYSDDKKDEELAKKNLLKFWKLQRQSIQKFYPQDLFEYIDSGFLEDYYRRIKNIKDADTREKKTLQIQFILDKIYSESATPLSNVQRTTVSNILQDIQDNTNKIVKVDDVKLKEKLIKFTGTNNKYTEIKSLIDIAINKIVNEYLMMGKLNNETVQLLYNKDSIYEYIRMTPDRDLDVLLLSGLFMHIMMYEDYIDLVSMDSMSIIYSDFHKYTEIYRLGLTGTSTLQNFRDFKSKIQKMDTRKKYQRGFQNYKTLERVKKQRSFCKFV
ncbi:MAG: hypothetical protein WCQ47_06145 [bacterium]